MSEVKIEAEASVKDDENTAGSGNIAALTALTFIDRIEAGKEATALVGYSEGGNLKIGSPDNWGNVGTYELTGDVRLQVTGGVFFDYKNVQAIRAYSGGSEFSFAVNATAGAASLKIADGSSDWVTITDGIVTASPNTTDSERECRIAVTVGGNNVGVFYIVQGKAITFSCASLAITDDRLERIGGTGSSTSITRVTFDISDDELEDMEIVPENNGTNGVTVTVNRSAKTIEVSFMALVDASLISAEGVNVPVRFVDINGKVNATLTVVQRPVKITFDPVKYPNISYKGATVTATVTTENNAKWNVKSITDKNGGSVSSWFTKVLPSTSGNSGSQLECLVASNGTTSSRIALVYVQANFTISKPYEIIQAPSYGLKDIEADAGWNSSDATLRAYSKGRAYNFTFATETAVPEGITLAADCGTGDLTAGEITKLTGNRYGFTLTVPDSEEADETTETVNITADGAAIGGFTVKRACKPAFVDVTDEVWGGVKDRPALRKATYRASEWDLKDFTSSNAAITATKISSEEIEVAYAETLLYSATAQSATITMNLNGGNTVSYDTRQAPVAFTISDTDLAKLKNVPKEAGNIEVTVTTQAGSAGVPWHVASVSDSWLTTAPAAGGPETNASGSALTVILAANTTGDRTGGFVLESYNTTSPTYEVSQNGAFSVTVGSVLYNGKSAIFESGILKAFSTGYDYTFNITVNNAVAGDKLSVVSRTTGSTVTIKTQPSGTALATSHSFVITVPTSTLTTEPESVFDIMADGNRIGGFTVKQAKKPSISVSTATVIGGSEAIGGTFTASVWELQSSGYVTSNNTNMAIGSPSTSGTFTVGMASSMDQSFTNRSATITLVGVTGSLATCTIAQNKVLYAFSPTNVTLIAAGESSEVTVTSSNAGTISSGMTVTSSQTWCQVVVSGNKLTVSASSNESTDKRSATVYVTYKNCQSQTFTVSQEAKIYVPTVTINGVQWTIYNLANPKQASGGATFATALPSALSGTRTNSHGKFYQWNRNVAWSTSGTSASGSTPSGSWQTALPTGSTWTDTPCPDGFRLPTNTEFRNLINACSKSYSSTWNATTYGYLTLTDNTNSNNKLEFPAVGRRDNDSSGKLSYNGVYGYYWTSDQSDASNAYRMIFNGNSVQADSPSEKQRGYSIRCVR